MSVPTVEYRGYEIRWNENADEWTCMEAGNKVGGQSLAKVKEQIDRINLADRKAAAYPCFELSDGHGKRQIEKTESQIVQYLGPKKERRGSWSDPKPPEVVDHRIAVVARRKGNERASRQEKNLSGLMPDTPEAIAAFKLAMQFRQIAIEAEAMADIAFKAIPRVQIEDIGGLVEIAEKEES